MKSDWKLKEEKDGVKTYTRVFYTTEYRIKEEKTGKCTWETDDIIVKALYSNFESAEQDVIKDSRL